MKASLEQSDKTLTNADTVVSGILKRIAGFRELTIILIILGIGAGLSIASPHFLSVNNFKAIALALSTDSIIVIGMTLVLISGGIDLSVGSVMGLAGIVTARLWQTYHLNIVAAVLIGLSIAVFVGFLNGLFIGRVGVNPFIVTMATMGMCRGLDYVITNGTPISVTNMPAAFRTLGTGLILDILPVLVLIMLIIAVISDYTLRRSSIARKVFYIGSNEKAAVLSGINAQNVKMGVYIVSSALAGIAGILTIARFGVAPATTGEPTAMMTISGAVIGGASMLGGEGTVLGSILGIVLMNFIANGIVMLNISVNWTQFVTGAVLMIAVTIDYLIHKDK